MNAGNALYNAFQYEWAELYAYFNKMKDAAQLQMESLKPKSSSTHVQSDDESEQTSIKTAHLETVSV